MRFLSSLRLVAAAVLALAFGHAGAAEAQSGPQPRPCPKPVYPAELARLKEEGITEIGFLIGTDGIVKRTVVLTSSGSTALDKAGLNVLASCVFRPIISKGQPVAMWFPVAYQWYVNDFSKYANARRRLERILKEKPDDADTLYYYSLLKNNSAASDADREHARALLRRAAQLGHAFAQVKVGMDYERGNGVQADQAEALRWYEKAAAQGNVIAIQRLESGPFVF